MSNSDHSLTESAGRDEPKRIRQVDLGGSSGEMLPDELYESLEIYDYFNKLEPKKPGNKSLVSGKPSNNANVSASKKFAEEMTKRIAEYYTNQSNCAKVCDAQRPEDRAPDRLATVLAQRYAEANCPDPHVSICPPNYADKRCEKALSHALWRLTVSVLTCDPLAGCQFVTRARWANRNTTGTQPVRMVVEALNNLYLVAPGLIASERSVHTNANAIAPDVVECIARMRPACWKLKDFDEDMLSKNGVNWSMVREIWERVFIERGTWINEVVFRILCAVPLRGGGSVTGNYRWDHDSNPNDSFL